MVGRKGSDMKSDRSVSLRSIIVPHPDKEIIYDLEPGLQVKFQGVPVSTNSCGMRSDEIPVVKPERTYRIALLGDSFAFGWGVERDAIFAKVIERLLNEEARPYGVRVEVLNFGVPGYSTFQEVASFLDKGLDFDPDLVIVYFVSNDFGLPFFLGNPNQGSSLMNAVDFARRVWNGDDPEHAEEKSFLHKRLDPNRSLRRLSRKLEKLGVPLYVAVNPGKSWKRDVKRLTVLKGSEAIPLITLRDEIRARVATENIPLEDLSLPTDPHPSALKHLMLGELIVAGVRKEVQSVVRSYE